MCKIPLTIAYDSSAPIKSARGVYQKQGEANPIDFDLDMSAPSTPEISEPGTYELVKVLLINEKDEEVTWNGPLTFTVGDCMQEMIVHETAGACKAVEQGSTPRSVFIRGAVVRDAIIYADADGGEPLSAGFFRQEIRVGENKEISSSEITVGENGRITLVSQCG